MTRTRDTRLPRTGLAVGLTVGLIAGLVVALGAGSAATTTAVAAQGRGGRHDAALVQAFEQLDQNTSWTLARTIPQTWLPAGADWEQEGLKFAGGRFYISVFDKTDDEGRLVVLRPDGTLLRNIPLPDGVRTHAGGIDVYGDAAYVPVAEDHAHSSADIYRVDTRTFAVRKLFSVPTDHVGGVTYDPQGNLLIGQDWDSRTFYEWTLRGRLVATWRNPNDYVGYQDCQYVPAQKLLCSASPLGLQKLPAFDLIDLSDRDHALLNGVPLAQGRAGNANELFATPSTGGTTITDYDASPGPIQVWTAVVPAGR